MEWAQEIGARIKEAREARGLTEADFADILVVHRNTVGNYERGKGLPNRELSRIAEALNVDLRWLLHGDSYRDPLVKIGERLERIERVLEVLTRDETSLSGAFAEQPDDPDEPGASATPPSAGSSRRVG
jgi:transcriptional regulator with XRE-family HTH domain